MRVLFVLIISAMGAIAADVRAGAAAVKITPPKGAPMAGYYYNRAADGVHDDLFAKALVLESEGVRAAERVAREVAVARAAIQYDVAMLNEVFSGAIDFPLHFGQVKWQNVLVLYWNPEFAFGRAPQFESVLLVRSLEPAVSQNSILGFGQQRAMFCAFHCSPERAYGAMPNRRQNHQAKRRIPRVSRSTQNQQQQKHC